MQVAETILQQLGGRGRLSAMLGANNFVGDHNSLTFRWKARSTWKGLKVTLQGDDTYTLMFFRVRGGKTTLHTPIGQVYAEDLIRVCEHETGLAWRL